MCTPGECGEASQDPRPISKDSIAMFRDKHSVTAPGVQVGRSRISSRIRISVDGCLTNEVNFAPTGEDGELLPYDQLALPRTGNILIDQALTLLSQTDRHLTRPT